MTITIGRFGTDVTTNLTKVSHQGSQIQLAGLILPTSFADAQVLRQQLTGLVNSLDEPVVPVVCTDDSSLDGFYSVTAANVDLDVAGRNVNNMMPWTATIVPVPGTASKAIAEAVQVVGLRSNSLGVTSSTFEPLPADRPVGVQNSAVETLTPTIFGTKLTGTRPGEDGSSQIPASTLHGAGIYPGWSYIRSDASPTTWYQNACRLEVGSNFRKTSGRMIIQDVANWRLSNGHVRVWASSSNAFLLNFQWHNGTSWSGTTQFEITYGATAYTSVSKAPPSVQVVANSPTRATVRITLGWRLYLYLSIRRGSHIVEVLADVYAMDLAGQAGIKASTVTAATALTNGIRATSNDAAGNRWVLTAPTAMTNDLVNGRFWAAASLTDGGTYFGVGVEVGGSGATGFLTAQNIVWEYFATISETLRVVNS